jgi:hypothetical protein
VTSISAVRGLLRVTLVMPQILARPYVVDSERPLTSDVELPAGNHRMRPARQAGDRTHGRRASAQVAKKRQRFLESPRLLARSLRAVITTPPFDSCRHHRLTEP